MATAFTPREREAIERALLASAMAHAASEGMRKTTVELLAADAGISKGAFYKFYESKEHLFLVVLEALHDEMYGNAARAMAESEALPVAQRVSKAIAEVCEVLRRHAMIRFLQEDVPLLLRRLPQKLLDGHYQSDRQHIYALLNSESFGLRIPLETACTIVRMLMMTLVHEKELGPDYQQALGEVIAAVCDRVICA